MSQKDETDVNDAFENLLFAEESAEKTGYEKGLTNDKKVIEGYHLGYHRASIIAARLGYYSGVVEYYLQNNKNAPEKVIVLGKRILQDIEKFPRYNDESVDIERTVDDIKTSYSKFCSLAKINPLYPEDDKSKTENMNFDTYVNNIADFLDKYKELIDCHLVDFLTKETWEYCLPAQLRSQLEACNNDCIQLHESKEVNDFIDRARSLSLDTCLDVINGNSTQIKLLTSYICKIKVQHAMEDQKPDFMKAKKCHEIKILGQIVAKMAHETSCLVIDAGAGKAYLSAHLSEVYGIPVVAMDSSKTCHRGAIIRQEKMRKEKKQSVPIIQYLVEEISDATDYSSIIKQHFPTWRVQENLMLTGLHTCGALADSLIRVFSREEHIRSILIVPCCYHLTNELLSQRFHLSKNARMLAQQSVERRVKDGSLQPSLFYRAVLQVLLHSIGLYNVRVGRGGPKNNFITYARWALTKIGVDVKKVPPDKDLEELYQSYQNLQRKFELFQMLRIYLSDVIEAAIMLERIIFLKSTGRYDDVGLLCLFDPLLSPRRYAFLATK